MPEQRWWHDQPAKHETPPAPAEEPFKTAGYGTFGLILAIVGPFIPAPLSVFVLIAALILGGLGLDRARQGRAGAGLPRATIIVAAVGLVLTFIFASM
ncbi:hypothetical protein [Saccharopolyspora phatthalungensis]|uniref:DUF4190 domain-containing protein n=1 Tax=Saccharopolyspora phatthalungensis TaxID=664693 RepID=A0A840Q1D7_9PSEU|nr:hypothetical protein [Saccharopolyspora phatthalungensis]MBB5152608.1 hypothetical protein [Saccharopolyspora phatthalungensis]